MLTKIEMWQDSDGNLYKSKEEGTLVLNFKKANLELEKFISFHHRGTDWEEEDLVWFLKDRATEVRKLLEPFDAL